MVGRAWYNRPAGQCHSGCTGNQRRTPQPWGADGAGRHAMSAVNPGVLSRLGEVVRMQQKRAASALDERGRAVHPSASNSARASCRSTVSKPSVNQS